MGGFAIYPISEITFMQHLSWPWQRFLRALIFAATVRLFMTKVNSAVARAMGSQQPCSLSG
jgi:hypothetical protein